MAVPSSRSAFKELCLRRLGKPVVAYMLGKSREGQALAVSHTGAMTGEADAISAFLAYNNIAEVRQFDALLEAPALLNKRVQLGQRPHRATVVTTTGGGGAMVVDQLCLRGLEVAELSPSTKSFFQKNNIPHGSGKLVDVTLAGARYDVMKKAIVQFCLLYTSPSPRDVEESGLAGCG